MTWRFRGVSARARGSLGERVTPMLYDRTVPLAYSFFASDQARSAFSPASALLGRRGHVVTMW